jgi:hypothetical protein
MQDARETPLPDHPNQPLDYEPSERTRRRRRLRRLFTIFTILALVALAWWQGPASYRRIARAYWQYRVARFTAPADRVVYEEDPSRWPALLAQPGYRKMPVSAPGWSPFVACLAEPVRRLSELTGARPGATALFAHARRAPDGGKHTVVVWIPINAVRPSAQGASSDNQVVVGLSTSVISGNTQRDGIHHVSIAPPSVAENRQTPLYARIYAGQRDPLDPTHFTIAYEIGEYADVLDGYLRDDGTVVLRPRKHDHPVNPG